MNKRCRLLTKENAANKRYYDSQIDELQKQVNTSMPIVQPSLKEKKTYTHDVRMYVYSLIDLNGATSKIPEFLKMITKTDEVPTKSSVERMAIELGVLSDMEVSIFFRVVCYFSYL